MEEVTSPRRHPEYEARRNAAPRILQRSLAPAAVQLLYVIAIFLLVTPTRAVLVPFQNCLPESYRETNPKALQFVPLFVDASFDTESDDHNLKVTVFGNVTGSYRNVSLPPPDSPDWEDPTKTDGKIENLPDLGNKYTTLFNKISVLTYEPWSKNVAFCEQVEGGECPLGPSFNANA
jgi:hypothetical protein